MLPSGKVTAWLTHLPSKYTLAVVLTDTPARVEVGEVVMAFERLEWLQF
jgi:hypothetical protein